MDTEQVREIASTAMLELTDSEAESLKDEFQNVLDMFDRLDEVETDGVDPSFTPIESSNSSRKDEVEESLSREDVFRNAENRQDSRFKGPSV